ncbi:MAG: zinc-ribbon domain-containing protein [Methyloceanibacter sp.]
MTVIICPACGARYEIAAIIPPEGRRVRCSKCAHVWQAKAVVEPAMPPAVLAPRPPVPAPRPAPMPPRPAPMAPAPAAPARAKDQSPAFPPQSTNGPLPGGRPTAAGADASFAGDEDFQADAGGRDDDWPKSPQDFGSFNAAASTDSASESADNSGAAGRRKLKLPSRLALGWGGLALLLAVLAAIVALAPMAVVSALPGANRLYAMMGNPVSLNDLVIVDVTSGWGVAGGQQVLEIAGFVANRASKQLTVPTVVIALQDQAGKVLQEFNTKVPPIAPGARVPFTAQISSTPETVRSVKVYLAKAD